MSNLSRTRLDSNEAVTKYMEIVNNSISIEKPKALYVGVAGNPVCAETGRVLPDMPSLYAKYNLCTLDFDAKWRPTIVGDITDPIKFSKGNEYNLIVMTQVIEHVPNINIVPSGLNYLLAKDGYVIIDSPWGPLGPDYHAEPPSFGDYWRISKDGYTYLFNKLFDIIDITQTQANVACLMKRR